MAERRPRARPVLLVAVLVGLGGVATVLSVAWAVPVTSPVPHGGGRVVVRFADPRITESSGLVVVGEDLVTVNDSGGDPVLYSVDAASGDTVATTRFAKTQTDVEALAPAADDPGAVWVGDIGNNDGSRSVVGVTRVAVDGTGDLGSATSYDLSYPGGETPDAETLLCHPRTGRLYVVTKSLLGGTVYAAPARLDPDRPNRLRPLGDVGPIITDGVFWPDGRHLVLRTYGQASLYRFPGLDPVGTLDLPAQEQGEAVTVAADGALLVSSEGAHAAVLRVRVPPRLRRVLDGAHASGADPSAPTTSPAPSPPADGPRPDSGPNEPGGSGGPDDGGGLQTVLWVLAGAVVAAGALLVVVFRRWYPAE